MNYELSSGTAYPLVNLTLAKGEQIKIEHGSMVYHNGEIELEGKMNSNGKKGLGGMLSAMGRSMTSGESFFISHVTGLTDNAKIAIAPPSIGSITELEIGGNRNWLLNTGVFLACDDSVSYNMVRQKVSKALFGGTGGLFVMETSGQGTMLVTSFGDLIELDLDGNQPFIIDNEHVVAWESNLSYAIKVASGTFGFTTGEGLVNEFHGAGKVLIQTRNLQGLAGTLSPFISSSSGD